MKGILFFSERINHYLWENGAFEVFFLLEKNGEILRRRNPIIIYWKIIVFFSSDANFHGKDQTSCTKTLHRSFLYVYF